MNNDQALRIFRGSAIVFTVLLCFCVIGSFAGAYSTFLELFSHFRLVYCFLFLPIIVVLVLGKRYKDCAIIVMFFLLNLIPVVALYSPAEANSGSNASEHIDVLQINLWGGRNNHHAQVLTLINKTSPAVIGFSEMTPTWEEYFKQNLPEYKYHIVENRFGGIGLFSRIPARDLKICYSGEAQRPRVEGALDLNGTQVRFILAHPLIPRIGSTARNDEFAIWAEEAQSIKEPFILFGDLNCSPWSPIFQRLLQNGRLYDSEQGFGPQPSWISLCPFVPIDHCLTNDLFKTELRQTCDYVGSDHLPVLVRLGFRKAK